MTKDARRLFAVWLVGLSLLVAGASLLMGVGGFLVALGAVLVVTALEEQRCS